MKAAVSPVKGSRTTVRQGHADLTTVLIASRKAKALVLSYTFGARSNSRFANEPNSMAVIGGKADCSRLQYSESLEGRMRSMGCFTTSKPPTSNSNTSIGLG